MKRTTSRRPERVAQLIKEEVASALATRVKDPRVGFVTVTRVEITNDLSVARVRLSVMGDEDEKQKALEGVESASGFLRSLVGQALSVRVAPELRFHLDRGLDHAAKMDRLFDELKKERDS